MNKKNILWTRRTCSRARSWSGRGSRMWGWTIGRRRFCSPEKSFCFFTWKQKTVLHPTGNHCCWRYVVDDHLGEGLPQRGTLLDGESSPPETLTLCTWSWSSWRWPLSPPSWSLWSSSPSSLTIQEILGGTKLPLVRPRPRQSSQQPPDDDDGDDDVDDGGDDNDFK